MKKTMTFIYQTFLLTSGNALCALAVITILVPHEFLSGGLTGLALLIRYKTQLLPVGAIYFIINIPIFLIGLKFIGLRFILYTGWGILIYSAMLLLPLPPLIISDKLLAAVAAAICTGTGIAIMLLSYGSPGGSEIISIILYKYAGITVGMATIIINAIILAISICMFPLENVIYTLIFISISAKITDMIFHGLAKRKAFMIVSSQWKDIIDEINNKTHIGATLLQGMGSFSGGDNQIIYSIVNRKDVIPLKKMIVEKDPSAFIAIAEASEVVGENVGNQPHW